MSNSINNFTNPAGIELQSEAMNEDGSSIFIQCTLAELSGASIDLEAKDFEIPFLTQIILQRIKAFSLPIEFTPCAALAINALVNNPGKAIALLVDALNKYRGEVVNMDKLANLYPNGFYTEDSFEKYVDEYLKPRKVKWAEIY